MRKDLYTNGSVDIPKISKKRSFFDLSHSSHIDLNAGILYPIDQVIQIAPGDTFDMSHALNIRMTNPPKTPTMDQLVFDIYYFYVPHRIVFDNFDAMMTNYSGNYYIDANYTIPTLDVVGASTVSYGNTLAFSALDYLGYGGVDILGSGYDVSFNPSALPLRGYCKIWNEYFRYESLQHEVLVPTDGNISTPFLNIGLASNYYSASLNPSSYYASLMGFPLYGNVLLPVNRLPGYFSRALPQPVAGDSVKILNDIEIGGLSSSDRVRFNFASSGGSYGQPLSIATGGQSTAMINGATDVPLNTISGNVLAGASNTIQALSNAFALNKFLYIDNLYGKRITEWTYGHFGVNVPDSRVQRPEYISKKRIYININQIMQSSETGTSPQGNAGAWSQTFDRGYDFTKSFVEFGYLFTLGCIRVLNHTFAQGIDRHWSYRTRYDFLLPEFSNVGDQPVYDREIFLNTSSTPGVFGYQERFAEYKMIPSRVAGHLRPQVSGSLALWTYTDYYTNTPTLSATWMFEPISNIDNTLYIASNVAPQFILDYVADIKAYRTLPYNSIPGGLTGSW